MVGTTRGLALAAVALSLLSVATGCTFSPTQGASAPASISTGSPPIVSTADDDRCLGEIFYPALPVQELNASLPLRNLSAEYIQYEIGVGKDGACEPVGLGSITPNDCRVPEARSDRGTPTMLGMTANDMTIAEFSRGADAAIAELVTGTTLDGSYKYRMTAWRYPDESGASRSFVGELVRGCTGAVTTEASHGQQTAVATDGGAPHLLFWVEGNTVNLFESIRAIGPDGVAERISDTENGLLPATAVELIRNWWATKGAGALQSQSAT